MRHVIYYNIKLKDALFLFNLLFQFLLQLIAVIILCILIVDTYSYSTVNCFTLIYFYFIFNTYTKIQIYFIHLCFILNIVIYYLIYNFYKNRLCHENNYY